MFYLCSLNSMSICSVIWQSSESLRSSWNKKLKVTSQCPFKLRTEVNNIFLVVVLFDSGQAGSSNRFSSQNDLLYCYVG